MSSTDFYIYTTLPVDCQLFFVFFIFLEKIGQIYEAGGSSIDVVTEYQQSTSSSRNTTMQAADDTKNRLFPIHAAAIATIKAAHAEIGLPVASRMAGKVMTASVTYGM